MSTLRVDTILGESGAERRGLMTYAIICDQKANDTDGGTFTSGAWRTRDLNTCLLYTSPSPRDLSTSRMPSSA